MLKWNIHAYNLVHTLEFPLVGLRWNIYPWCLNQSGQLELFLRCLNVKYARRLQNFTNASRSQKSSKFVFHTPVRSLARPNFLTGAIIETRFQALLLDPPVYFHPELPPSESPRSCLLKFLKSPGKFFGPAKPFLDNLYLKTERCICLKLLVWREPLFIWRICE